MKFNKLALSCVISSIVSPAFASSISSQCENGVAEFIYDVSEGEACSVTETVKVNGVEEVTELTLDESTSRTLKLLSSDEIEAISTMSCGSGGVRMSFAARIRVKDGCGAEEEGHSLTGHNVFSDSLSSPEPESSPTPAPVPSPITSDPIAVPDPVYTKPESSRVASQCKNGMAEFIYEVSEGEVCHVTEKVKVNGVKRVTEITLSESTSRTLKLLSKDKIKAMSTMSCGSGGVRTIFVGRIKVKDGCGSEEVGRSSEGHNVFSGSLYPPESESNPSPAPVPSPVTSDPVAVPDPVYAKPETSKPSSPIIAGSDVGNVYICNPMSGCAETAEILNQIEEFGDKRPLEIIFEQSEDLTQTSDPQLVLKAPTEFPSRVGVTFSEMLGLGQVFLGRSADQYRTIEFARFNDSLSVIFYKAIDRLVIRRDNDESARVIMTFDQFINTLEQAYPHFSAQKVVSKYFDVSHSTTDTYTRMVARSKVVSSHGPNVDFFGEYARASNMQHTVYQTFADREGESSRNPSHSTTTIMDDGTGSYTYSSLSINGFNAPHETRLVQPQVNSTREELGTNVNGRVKVTRGLQIDINGEDSIIRNGDNSTYCQWRFSSFGLLSPLFGGNGCEDAQNTDEESTVDWVSSNTNVNSSFNASSSGFDDLLNGTWDSAASAWPNSDYVPGFTFMSLFNQKHEEMRERYYNN